MEHYLNIPLRMSEVMASKKLQRCSLVDSIKHYIRLIIITRYNEYRADPCFGSSIWQDEYQVLPDQSEWQTAFKESVFQSIKKDEIRLSDIEVRLQLQETTLLRKKAIIEVTGVISSTGEPFVHQEIIYMCPAATEKSR
ncbi:MAG TPA: GPW/gp25 family protein [bacterium]|nr:GPW/gp25 family protein [bacterium]